MNLQLNLATGTALKQAGQQLALDYSGAWQDDVIEEFRDWLRVQKARGAIDITIEEFRSQAKAQPASHKAWGSLPRIADSRRPDRAAVGRAWCAGAQEGVGTEDPRPRGEAMGGAVMSVRTTKATAGRTYEGAAA